MLPLLLILLLSVVVHKCLWSCLSCFQLLLLLPQKVFSVIMAISTPAASVVAASSSVVTPVTLATAPLLMPRLPLPLLSPLGASTTVLPVVCPAASVAASFPSRYCHSCYLCCCREPLSLAWLPLRRLSLTLILLPQPQPLLPCVHQPPDSNRCCQGTQLLGHRVSYQRLY